MACRSTDAFKARRLLVSAYGISKGENSLNGIKGVQEEHGRSALKTVTWRIIATSTGMFLVYLFTGQLELTAGFGISDVVLKMIFYFIHERVWNKIAFGKTLRGTMHSAMRESPLRVPPSETTSGIVQRMITTDIGAVIVVEGDRPIGLITERDILDRVLNASKDPSRTFARDIMSSPVTTVEHNTSLVDALKVMRDRQIRRLGVTQDGKLIGIVTERRILRALI